VANTGAFPSGTGAPRDDGVGGGGGDGGKGNAATADEFMEMNIDVDPEWGESIASTTASDQGAGNLVLPKRCRRAGAGGIGYAFR